ncbi:glycosyltransferase family 87 protein [Dankookia sp. GCM10030260]
MNRSLPLLGMRIWQLVMLLVVGSSVLVGAAGVVFKAEIVRALPAAEEAAAPPNGFSHFIENGIDSWKPMKLGLTIFRSSEGGRLYEAVRDFQLENNSLDGLLTQYADAKKFQYPLTSLLPLELLEAIGISSIAQLNLLNLVFFVANLAGILYLCNLLFEQEAKKLPRAASMQLESGRLWISALFLVVAATYYPTYNALGKGNIQVWINCFFTFACIAWLSGRYFWVGLLVALAAAIKPQLGALLVWAVLWRQWAFCRGFLWAAVPLGIAALVHYGLHNNLAYLDLLSVISQHGERHFVNESVNGILHRLYEHGNGALLWDKDDYAPYRPLVYALTLASSLVFALIAFLPALFRRQEGPTIMDFVVASICITLGSPIVWLYHYGVLLPAFVIALSAVLREAASPARTRLLAMLGVSWLLCASYLPFARLIYLSPWNIIANPRFFGALLLLFVLIHVGRVWRRRPVQAAGLSAPA